MKVKKYIKNVKGVTSRKTFIVLYILIFALFFILQNLSENLPSTQSQVNYPGQNISGQIQSHVYLKEQPSDNLVMSKDVFLGGLWYIQFLDKRTVGYILLISFSLIILTILSHRFSTKKKHLKFTFFILCSCLSIFLSFRIGQGWDEFFINLKHSYNLSLHGLYSANFSNHTEATVDFLPFLLVGLLNKIFKVPLVETAIFFSSLGNIMIIVVSFFVVFKLTKSNTPSFLASIIVALFPPVIYLGATGFMAGFFSGFLLLAIYWVSLKKGKYTFFGFVILGLLPLIRVESLLFSSLVYVFYLFLRAIRIFIKSTKKKRAIKKILRILAVYFVIVISPFLLLTAFRYIYFGSMIPNPVIFKNATGNIDYIRVGLQQLINTIKQYKFDLLFIFIGPTLLWFISFIQKKQIAIILSLMIFILTYYSGGGDWFPITWSRYLMPFLLYGILLLISSLYIYTKLYFNRSNIVFALILIFITLLIATSEKKSNVYLNSVKDISSSYDRWGRVNNLAEYGEFLKATTPQSAIIGSPEVATIMYFAERDIYDLLGVANPEIARTKLNPRTPGDILHRKRNLESIKETPPSILALWEMAFTLPRDFKSNNLVEITKFVQGSALSQDMIDISYYRTGSYAFLESLGYKSLTIIEGEKLYFYWVHKSLWDEHSSMLEKNNFKSVGDIKLSYTVSDYFSNRFSSGFSYSGVKYGSLENLEIKDIGASVHEINGWVENGQYPDFKTPPNVKSFGSWNGNDSNIGKIKIGPINLKEKIKIPIIVGPDSTYQTLKIVGAHNEEIIFETTIKPPEVHKWYYMELMMTPENQNQSVYIIGEDNGKSFGQWFAIGMPFAN
jgi:hypothetical protein